MGTCKNYPTTLQQTTPECSDWHRRKRGSLRFKMPFGSFRSDFRFWSYRRWKRSLIFLPSLSLSLSRSLARTSQSHSLTHSLTYTERATCALLNDTRWVSGFLLLLVVSTHLRERMWVTPLTNIPGVSELAFQIHISRTDWGIQLK